MQLPILFPKEKSFLFGNLDRSLYRMLRTNASTPGFFHLAWSLSYAVKWQGPVHHHAIQREFENRYTSFYQILPKEISQQFIGNLRLGIHTVNGVDSHWSKRLLIHIVFPGWFMFVRRCNRKSKSVCIEILNERPQKGHLKGVTPIIIIFFNVPSLFQGGWCKTVQATLLHACFPSSNHSKVA